MKFFNIFLFVLMAVQMFGQTATLEGYVFESNNRGYLNLVRISIIDQETKAELTKIYSDKQGFFTAELPLERDFLIRAEKDVFKKQEAPISTRGVAEGGKLFAKIKMERKPGYIFDVTIAEERIEDNPADAILGARIEVYNNTQKKEILVLENHPIPTFSVTFENGNHYTVMIRKNGFFTKRMEAYVDIKDCILCFDGVGEVRPAVSDNLTAGHQMGTLIANVELKKMELEKGFRIENIYYDLDKWDIRSDAAKELDKLITVLRDNPQVIVELGSHTDARGQDAYNQELSQKRAQSAVDYILEVGGIQSGRIQARGYGESKLVNTCGNGVQCSESKHQENRRTELKIVGFLAENSINKLSLAEILEQEEFDRLLAEVQSSEEIRVEAGADLPEELKNKKEDQVESVPEEQSKQDSLVDNTIEITVLNPTNPKSESLSVNSSSTQLEPEDPKPLQLESVVSPDASAKVHESEVMDPETQSKIIAEYEVRRDLRLNRPRALPAFYEGYKVEFHTSPFELPLSHVIFSQHGGITVEQKKEGGFAYLLGNFRNPKAANKFLANVIMPRYPRANVVRYIRGNRVAP